MWLGDCSFTTIDTSQNPLLIMFYCQGYGNGGTLTSIDVTNNTALITLHCGDNQLTSLDVTNNITLTTFDCSDNQLTSLNVSNNIALTSLFCVNNQLTSLDASTNTALVWLHTNDNLLTSLDISNGNNTNLGAIQFRAYNNSLTTITCDNPATAATTYCADGGTCGCGCNATPGCIDCCVTFV